MEATLLVELLTEELPPKSLRELSECFARELHSALEKERLLSTQSTVRAYATPRRLAALITAVKDRSPDMEREVQGPSIGAPAQAVAGFARKSGIAVEALRRAQTPKGEVHVALVKTSGKALDTLLAPAVDSAVRALPISKLMRWGEGEAQFVRPVHGLVMLHGVREIPGTVLGVAASSTTRGHRFMGARSIALKNADEYEARLRDDGMVIADFASRRAAIEQQLAAEAKRQGALLGDDQGLLDEVTALVEHPTVYPGTFDPAFLALPQECLTLTMRQNQKYFPLFDAAGKLLPKFLMVSNMRVADPRHIVSGNERVIRPRLEDARFFYDQDQKIRLEERVPHLAMVVYHNKLGTQLERVERVQLLAGRIAREIGADAALAERAAWLAKADLVTGMVGEFPELQGVMGRYYAQHDGEPPQICDAIGAQYRLRFDDHDPEDLVSASLYIADRVDTLVGFFGIGQAPTGEKDPFGLRRAALGLISAFEIVGAARKLAGAALPDIRVFLDHSASLFPVGRVSSVAVDQVHEFILDRYWHQLAAVFPKTTVESVISKKPKLDEVVERLRAVEEFRKLPQAQSLAEADKRVRNILRKSDATHGKLDESLLREKEERDLFNFMRDINKEIALFVQQGDYTASLTATATVQPSVTAFFDKVMVNADDAKLRANRHALLKELGDILNQVADISKLSE